MTVINGVDVSGLTLEADVAVPATVPGRVVHIDGDFIAYMVAYDDNKSLEAMKHNCDTKIEKLRLMAGAESLVIHLTHKDSNKGNRHNLALLREYQEKRKKIKPKYLHLMRAYMHDKFNGLNHLDCEADDGMAIAQYAAIARGERHLSVIATKDKDLLMVDGLQLDWDTGEISDIPDPFGYIELCRDKAQPKIRGRGWKMFWAQMLTGDTADNISGLPYVCDLKYLPNGKPKRCGPVLAYEILSPLTTNKEAFETVRGLFEQCNEYEPFVNWRDNSPVTPGKALASEAKLLWMRRNKDENDVINWLKETCL